MKSRVEKNHGKQLANQLIHEKQNEALHAQPDNLMVIESEQIQQETVTQKRWTIDQTNRFLNIGIIVMSIALVIILVIAFSK